MSVDGHDHWSPDADEFLGEVEAGGIMETLAVDSRLSEPTAASLSHKHKLLIDDEWVAAASGKTFPVYNPATGTVLALVAGAS